MSFHLIASAPASAAADSDACSSPRSVSTPEPVHGYGEMDCEGCDQTDHCDCPCQTCISARRTIPPTPGLQDTLDIEWATANFSGPGCPFCDAMISCSCWEQRREMQQMEESRKMRAERAAVAAAIAAGNCACEFLSEQALDYGAMCEICQREEELRCKDCGKLECGGGCYSGESGDAESDGYPYEDGPSENPYEEETYYERMEREECAEEARWLEREERRRSARPVAITGAA